MFEMLVTGAKNHADHEWDGALALDREAFALEDDRGRIERWKK